jgi:predicted DCC family thiol-disulfide oxidoreductase YuxK
MGLPDLPSAGAVIVYDGRCPFCANYIRLLRLRETLAHVKLIDARKGGRVVDALIRRNIDFDAGMVLILDGSIYHGADGMHRLALMTTPSTHFNMLNRWIFRSERKSRIVYPMLRALRNLTLRLLGRNTLARSLRAGLRL